jgi:protein-serine/threonine kinase
MVCGPESRLGRNGAIEIKNHPFFAGVDFNSLRRIRAPFEPPLTSDIDTSCFPVDELPQGEDPPPAGAVESATGAANESLTPEMFLPFLGYTFKRFEKTYR